MRWHNLTCDCESCAELVRRAKLHVAFDVESYVEAHGKRPRGNGWWMFLGPDGIVFEGAGYYGDAKYEVVQAARFHYAEDYYGSAPNGRVCLQLLP